MAQKSDTRRNKFTLDAEQPTFEGGKVRDFKVGEIVGNETAVSMLFVEHNKLEDKLRQAQEKLEQETNKLHQTKLTLTEYKTYSSVSFLGTIINIFSGVLIAFSINRISSDKKEIFEWTCLAIGVLLAFLGVYMQQGKWLDPLTKWINKRLSVNQEQ